MSPNLMHAAYIACVETSLGDVRTLTLLQRCTRPGFWSTLGLGYLFYGIASCCFEVRSGIRLILITIGGGLIVIGGFLLVPYLIFCLKTAPRWEQSLAILYLAAFSAVTIYSVLQFD
jgi:uncharacterized membrane protein YfcA